MTSYRCLSVINGTLPEMAPAPILSCQFSDITGKLKIIGHHDRYHYIMATLTCAGRSKLT